tara:strand:+ start:105 stop:515 length:411 start_codon:yes stop_codon:yes gene_type:complete
MFLIDTNFISELRRPKPNPQVVEWVNALTTEQLFISAVTIGEIQAGIELTREQDPEKASQLEAWLIQVSRSYNILPMDAETFRHWAKLMHQQSNTLIEDAMIAATAISNGLTVATRNTRDFEALGLEAFDPFQRAA